MLHTCITWEKESVAWGVVIINPGVLTCVSFEGIEMMMMMMMMLGIFFCAAVHVTVLKVPPGGRLWLTGLGWADGGFLDCGFVGMDRRNCR